MNRAEYDRYFRSDKWRDLRELVLQRAGGICEGCGRRRAIQVHHLTYQHAGAEFLWELRAICGSCHKRIHEIKS